MDIKKKVFLSQFSTFGIGGMAEYFLVVKSIFELQEAFRFVHTKNLPYFVLGKGSNCLFDDRGYRGIVIHNGIDFYERKEGEYYLGAGTSLSHFSYESSQNNYGGMEFALGIPGSVGGAIYMNAAAHGMDIAKIVKEVDFIHENGTRETYNANMIQFAYRYSSFQKMKGAIAAAHFSLYPSNVARLQGEEFLQKRKKNQPLSYQSAGCIFRNPKKGLSAGYLIEQCGLKGIKEGKALISSKHANFIINEGGAKTQDVLILIDRIQKTVHKKFGVFLELELKIIPYKETIDE